jgi:hypothetical protein
MPMEFLHGHHYDAWGWSVWSSRRRGKMEMEEEDGNRY